jgi:hypothetical protein
MKISLCDYVKKIRAQEESWKKMNPNAHPVEFYRDIGKTVAEWAVEDGVTEVTVPNAVYMGGVPEYTFAIAYLSEEGIKTKKEDI